MIGKHKGERWLNPLFYLLFLMIAWITWYWKLSRFGYYEDDYWFAVLPAGMDFKELMNMLWGYMTDFKGNSGRVVGSSLPYLISWIMYHLGGKPMLYIWHIPGGMQRLSLLQDRRKKWQLVAGFLCGGGIYCFSW